MTANNPITDLLAAPLDPEWTIERLAEDVLSALAASASDEPQEFVLDGETTTDRQSRRLLRPLLACLATKSAAETGIRINLYGGQISFQRPTDHGPVWIFGQFENTSATVHIIFRPSSLPPRGFEPTTGQVPVLTIRDN